MRPTQAVQRQEPPFILAMDSLEDPQNVGTLLRSAEAAGVHGVLFPTHRQAPLTLAPSEYFVRQCWVSFDPGEHTMGLLTPVVGSERFIWASDFPHSDAKYPGVVDELREHTAAMDDDAKANLYGTNALRMYGLR